MTLAEIKALREQRATIVAEMRTINEKAETEKRDLTAAEQERWDAANKDVDALADKIDAAESEARREARRSFIESRTKELDSPAGRPSTRPAEDGDTRRNPDADASQAAYSKAFRNYLRQEITDRELRALQADLPTTGGYLVAPVQFQNDLIKFIDNETFVRGLATVITMTSADSIQFPSWETDPTDPTWTAEISAGSEDSSARTGARSLTPRPLAQFIKISNTLIRKSVVPIETLVQQRLAYKAGVVMENAFLNGDGSSAPLGVFTPHAQGVTTSQDVSTDNSTSAFSADGLINCKYYIKGQYQARAVWVMHRDAVKMARKLKDGEGNYLWQPGIGSDVMGTDTLLGRPVYMSEYAPSTFTTGERVAVFGDFSKYVIVDALTMTIQVANELHLATNQTGYYLRAECDGMPVLSEAFARVKLA